MTMYVVRFSNGRYLAHNAVLMRKPDPASPYASSYWLNMWKHQLLTHTTADLQNARTYDSVKSAVLSTKRGGYTADEYEVLEVTLTLK